MMVIFFLILVILTFIHFFYEGILAPSLRYSLRLKLFALRDDLRDLKIDRQEELTDEVFCDLQDAINGAIMRVNQIDLSLLKAAHEAIEHDEKLRKRLQARIAMFEACPLEDVKVIRHRCFELLDQALAINSGGLFPYLIPIIIGFLFADKARSLVVSVFSLPENDLDRIVPPPFVAVPA